MDVTTLPEADNSITATYSGDTNYAASTSPAVTVTVGQASSSTHLDPVDHNTGLRAKVSSSATVQRGQPRAGTPTGTVQFFNGTTDLGTPMTLTSGTASYVATSLALGSNSITAVYSGDTNFKGQTSTATALTVAQASTMTDLDLDAHSPVFGQPVTLTATVAAVTAPAQARRRERSISCPDRPRSARERIIRRCRQHQHFSSSGGQQHDLHGLFGRYRLCGPTSTGTVTIGQASSTTTLTVSNTNSQRNPIGHLDGHGGRGQPRRGLPPAPWNS